jgi:hypothetical protein
MAAAGRPIWRAVAGSGRWRPKGLLPVKRASRFTGFFDLKQKGWDFRTEMKDDKNTVHVVAKVPEPDQLTL